MEISPSRRGIKIFCKARLERGRKTEFFIDGEKCAVEAYSWDRFFTITGKRWQNAPPAITPHQADVETALEIAAKHAKPSPPLRPLLPETVTSRSQGAMMRWRRWASCVWRPERRRDRSCAPRL